MQGKEITLSTGEVVFVATMPQKMGDILRKQYPGPPIPIKEDTTHPTATGEPVFYEDDKDPEYLIELARVGAQRNLKWGEGQLLFGLPHVKVPKGYRCPRCQFTAESEEELRESAAGTMRGTVVMVSEDGPYCCPRCYDDCKLDQEDVPALERYVWEPPAENIQYFDPDWQPRLGEKGRKIDYIEWELLKNPMDMTLFFMTINELTGIEEELEEAADAVEDSFPSGLEGESD